MPAFGFQRVLSISWIGDDFCDDGTPFEFDCAAFGFDGGDCIGGDHARTSCTACTAGFFARNAAETVCIACSMGKFQSDAGATQCSFCMPGWSTAEIGSSACIECGAGQFSRGAGELCSSCQPGTVSTDEGSSECHACDVGRFQNASMGYSGCMSCMPGHFQNSPGATRCKKCEIGQYTDTVQSSACSACQPGWYLSFESICIACPAGMYQASGAATSCDVCGDNEYSGTAATECFVATTLGRLSSSKGNSVSNTLSSASDRPQEITTGPAMTSASVRNGSDASASGLLGDLSEATVTLMVIVVAVVVVAVVIIVVVVIVCRINESKARIRQVAAGSKSGTATTAGSIGTKPAPSETKYEAATPSGSAGAPVQRQSAGSDIFAGERGRQKERRRARREAASGRRSAALRDVDVELTVQKQWHQSRGVPSHTEQPLPPAGSATIKNRSPVNERVHHSRSTVENPVPERQTARSRSPSQASSVGDSNGWESPGSTGSLSGEDSSSVKAEAGPRPTLPLSHLVHLRPLPSPPATPFRSNGSLQQKKAVELLIPGPADPAASRMGSATTIGSAKEETLRSSRPSHAADKRVLES